MRQFNQGLLIVFLGALCAAAIAGCAAHGSLSLRSEAFGHYKAALTAPGFREILEKREPRQQADVEGLEECLAQTQRALEIDPYLFPAHLTTIQLLALLDRPEECEEHLLYCLELFPDAVTVREEAVFMEFDRFRNPDRAALILEEGLRRNPNHPGFHLLHAELLADSKGSKNKIEEIIETLLSFRSLPATTWYRIIGLCVYLSEESDEGQIDPDSALPLIKLAHQEPSVLNESVAWLLAAGLADSAKGLFIYAAQLPDAPFDLKLVTARLLVRLEEGQAAAEIVADLMVDSSSEGREAALLAVKGHIKWVEGKPQEALPLFTESLNKDPANFDALDGIWLLYERTPLVGVDQIEDHLKRAAEATQDPLVRNFLRSKARMLQAPSDPLDPNPSDPEDPNPSDPLDPNPSDPEDRQDSRK